MRLTIRGDGVVSTLGLCPLSGPCPLSVEPAPSIIESEPDALIVSNFSKYYYITGWRIGWLLGSRNDIERVRAYSSNLFLTAPALSQHAALVAPDSREELEAKMAVYRQNRLLILNALLSLGLDAIAPPDGAFYVHGNV
jgi:aspartate/methionine/tyrosine aminotransferase